ncbi:hypothetical protein D5R81_06260 [Parashewanella spongiae]|uniref:Uncharacterized protein n=1 Tax=Parashewanella spongiae TaxID=342950 RepID=A0A3A6UKX9_9GAMM|nr:hypothetical protein [Parashewanella spongiae]MCL1077670.1 hypothetical protein [Parashewanella spongiae]RJY18244.1 hypothetical protein D5R81_06260 [Parashewanella spongiae]
MDIIKHANQSNSAKTTLAEKNISSFHESSPLIKPEIDKATGNILLQFDNKSYFSNIKNTQSLSMPLLVKIIKQNPPFRNTNQLSADLYSPSKTESITLPISLFKLLNDSKTNSSELQALLNVQKSYPLGVGQIINKQLYLSGNKIPLVDSLLSNGKYIAHIKYLNQKPLLSLTKLTYLQRIELFPLPLKTTSALASNIQKNYFAIEMATSYRNIIASLNQNESGVETDKIKSKQLVRLESLIVNTGAVKAPVATSNLYSDKPFNKIVDLMMPPTLNKLLEIKSLKNSLFTAALFNPASPVNFQKSTNSSINFVTITALFHILISTSKLSKNLNPETLKYIDELQKKVADSQNLLIKRLMECIDPHCNTLVKQIQVYQQASYVSDKELCWLFALPYTVDERVSCLEGKLEHCQSQQSEPSSEQWSLKLKFDLADGPLLIIATYELDKNVKLELRTNQRVVLNKTKQYQHHLVNRLKAVGIDCHNILVTQGEVPYSFLNNNNQLIKTMV